MFQTKIRKVGNSSVVTISAEMLAALDVKDGDTVYVTRSNDNGLKIQAHDPAVLEALAAAYAFGITKAHAFVDGNKRTAFVTSATFLRLSGWHFVTEPKEGVAFMEGLASDEVSEEKFKNWSELGAKEIL